MSDGRRPGSDDRKRRSPAPPGTHAAVAVAVDVVPFALREGRLHAALIGVRATEESRLFAFPGGRVQPEESLDVAARRCLERHVPSEGRFLEQLYAFGEPGRDPGSRVVSVAYLALLPRADDADGVHWYPCDDLPPLAYDHGAVADKALERLQGKLAYTNIAFGLLEDGFTLADLQRVYEAVLGRGLDRRNFRKKVLALELVQPLGRVRHGPHRPAELFGFTERALVTVETLLTKKG